MRVVDVKLNLDADVRGSTVSAIAPPARAADLAAHAIALRAPDPTALPYRLIGGAPEAHHNGRNGNNGYDSTPSAVVVSCPHAGRQYPEDLLAASTSGLAALRDLEDFAVDQLLGGLHGSSIGGISNTIARAYLDVNRPEDALDQTMFYEPVSNVKPSRKVLAGYGLLPRLTGARTPIHKHLLPASEVSRRLALVYWPYHKQLRHLLDQATKNHGRYMLLDCHSMPALDHHNKKLPDIILGNCHGRTLDPQTSKHIDNLIRDNGFSLAWNTPYSGGFITSHYGTAASLGQSLQIEINRALYMSGADQLDETGTQRVTTLLASIATQLDSVITSW